MIRTHTRRFINGPWVLPSPGGTPSGGLAVPAGAVSMPAPSGGDDTPALITAATTALAGTKTRVGPTGSTQGVVYFPPAAQPYLISHYVWPSNLCIAVDASVVIQLPPGAGISGTQHLRAAMFLWGAESNNPTQISNVSLITTGADASSAAKVAFLAADPVLTVVDVAHCFTTNHDADPITGTKATNSALAVDICYVTGFELTGLFQVHNNVDSLDDGGDSYPTSSICGVAMRAASGSPLGGAPSTFYQPSNGTIGTLAATTSPFGYGPIQINACSNVAFGTIASLGGTPCRIETDGSLVNKNHGGMDRGATVDGLTCTNAIGAHGNHAVAFTPHGQFNGSVHVGTATSSCSYQTVVAARSNNTGGYFTSAIIDTIIAIGGAGAQGPHDGTYLWTTVPSDSAVQVDKTLQWKAALSLPTAVRTGTFVSRDVYG